MTHVKTNFTVAKEIRDFTENEVTVFIDVTEKIFGAQPGTMSFVSGLILGGLNDE